jgi:leucyl aminopeptidase
MNFELKTLELASAAALVCDALVVLVPEGCKPGKDEFSLLLGQALKAGDLETKAGKLLALYRPASARCSRAILVGAGDGSPRQVRQAVTAAVGALRTGAPSLKKLVLCFAGPAQSGAVRAAVSALADASYVYTSTKSKAEGRSLARVTVGVPKLAVCKAEFDRAVATLSGIELAKEWANRPANHATPSDLAQAARALAKLPRISCQVLGPREVAKLKMGAFMAVAQGSEQPLRFIVLN